MVGRGLEKGKGVQECGGVGMCEAGAVAHLQGAGSQHIYIYSIIYSAPAHPVGPQILVQESSFPPFQPT